MTREEAIAILEVSKHMATSGRMYNQAIDMAIEALQREEAEEKGYCHRIKPKEYFSADAETMTEEVREALMRLTMCAREECAICKYKDECGYDFQYKISTDNMNTLSDALMRSRCEVEIKKVELKDGFKIDDIPQDWKPKVIGNVEVVVRCKDCRHRDLFSCPLTDNDFQKDEDFCSWGERKEP